MADLKSIGSEKLPLDQKLKRIMEIANYGITEPKSTHKTATLEYSITAADGNKYGIIRENSQYNILKEGKEGYRYLDGMLNNKKYTFTSFSTALKKLNLLMKPLNESHNSGKQLNLIGEQEEEDTKYILKTPEGEEEEDFSMDIEGGEEDLDLGGEEDLDLGGEEELGAAEVELGAEEEENFTKAIQKLTGKLGQKLRDIPETELDGDLIKYVLNSVVSAVDLTKLSPEDVEDIVNKIEGEEELDYTEEGEFDVDLSGEEELDIEGELDLEGEGELDLETELAEEELDEFWPAVGRTAAAAARTKAGQAAIGAGIDYGARKLSKAFNEQGPPLNAAGLKDVDEDVMDSIAGIFGEGKSHQTLSKYFEYTPAEKRKITVKEQKKNKKIKIQQDKLLNEALTEASNNKKIKNSLCTYEQEDAVKNFLKENENNKFMGINSRESLIFKDSEETLVEITKYGTKI